MKKLRTDEELRLLKRLRWETQTWVQGNLSTWTDTSLVSLNFKEAIQGENGSPVHLSESLARREVELLCKRVDRAIYGRSVQRFNRRVRRIPFLEYGHDRGWHAHILVERPAHVVGVRFLQTVKNAWAESPWSTNLHQRAADDGASYYLTKDRSKAEFEAWIDTVVLEAVFLGPK